MWLPLRLHGVSAFREALDEKLDLTDHLARRLSEDPRIEMPWAPQLTVVPFRLAGADDDVQRRFLERINASKRVFLSSTMIGGRYVLRACILSHRTHKDRIDECVDIVRAAAGEMAG